MILSETETVVYSIDSPEDALRIHEIWRMEADQRAFAALWAYVMPTVRALAYSFAGSYPHLTFDYFLTHRRVSIGVQQAIENYDPVKANGRSLISFVRQAAKWGLSQALRSGEAKRIKRTDSVDRSIYDDGVATHLDRLQYENAVEADEVISRDEASALFKAACHLLLTDKQLEALGVELGISDTRDLMAARGVSRQAITQLKVAAKRKIALVLADLAQSLGVDDGIVDSISAEHLFISRCLPGAAVIGEDFIRNKKGIAAAGISLSQGIPTISDPSRRFNVTSIAMAEGGYRPGYSFVNDSQDVQDVFCIDDADFDALAKDRDVLSVLRSRDSLKAMMDHFDIYFLEDEGIWHVNVQTDRFREKWFKYQDKNRTGVFVLSALGIDAKATQPNICKCFELIFGEGNLRFQKSRSGGRYVERCPRQSLMLQLRTSENIRVLKNYGLRVFNGIAIVDISNRRFFESVKGNNPARFRINGRLVSARTVLPALGFKMNNPGILKFCEELLPNHNVVSGRHANGVSKQPMATSIFLNAMKNDRENRRKLESKARFLSNGRMLVCATVDDFKGLSFRVEGAHRSTYGIQGMILHCGRDVYGYPTVDDIAWLYCQIFRGKEVVRSIPPDVLLADLRSEANLAVVEGHLAQISDDLFGLLTRRIADFYRHRFEVDFGRRGLEKIGIGEALSIFGREFSPDNVLWLYREILNLNDVALVA